MKLFQHLRSTSASRRSMPSTLLAASVLTSALLFTAACGSSTETTTTEPAAEVEDDPDRAVAGGTLPAGWEVRADRGAGDDIIMNQQGDGYHFTMGSAGTFYNPEWFKNGDFSYSARVTQTAEPTHAISYGLVIGGSYIDGPNQEYTYFLTRNEGDYFIANRNGEERVVVTDWTASDALAPQAEDGTQTNVLGVQVSGNNVIFMANGTEVARLPKNQVHADGMIGFRIGHNLDVDVSEIMR